MQYQQYNGRIDFNRKVLKMSTGSFYAILKRTSKGFNSAATYDPERFELKSGQKTEPNMCKIQRISGV